ncbi:MAG TPA: histidine phosphatase family protein [Acidimicrobiales bacterium]|nr:histidine phosphatase family protein [Acidimicrobiales bacterium]
MSAHEVVLVRHGQTEWSVSGQHTGRTDIPLTDEGRVQAEALGARLSRWRFARVLSSPLARALDTCRLAGMGDRVEITDDLREWDYGEYEGRRTADIREERPGWGLWIHGVPGGETVGEVGRRADRVIEGARQADGDVALFAHGHVLRVLAARWLGLPPDHGRLLALSTASISVLGWERETAVVERWNETPDD